jgi:hypothetical protein
MHESNLISATENKRVLIKDNFLYSHTYSSWAVIKNGVPHGLILGPLLFLFYTNDLPTFIKNKTKPVPFVDDTNILIKNLSLLNFKKEIINIFEQLNKWFGDNLLALNFDKTYFCQLKNKSHSLNEININYNSIIIIQVHIL